MRTCSKCQKPQPLTEYYLDPKGKDGRSARCRSCKRAKNKFKATLRKLEKRPDIAQPTKKANTQPSEDNMKKLEQILKGKGARLQYNAHFNNFYFVSFEPRVSVEVKSLGELMKLTNTP